MPAYKVTMVFGMSGQGWTESYTYNTPATLPLLQVYNNFAVPLINARIAILTSAATITYCRISTQFVRWSAQIFDVSLTGTYGSNAAIGAALVQGVIPNLALLVRCYPVAPGPGKSVFLRGLPYTVCTPNGYNPNGFWKKMIQAFFAVLTGGGQGTGWGWIGVTELSQIRCPVLTYAQIPQAPNQFQVNITFSVNAAGQSIFAGQPVGTKGYVRLSGINGKSELNGTQVVIVTGDLTCMTKDQFGVVPYNHGGTGLSNTYSFTPIGSCSDERLVSRKAGRTLFLERGRQPNRART
jgi:hypothetical protein